MPPVVAEVEGASGREKTEDIDIFCYAEICKLYFLKMYPRGQMLQINAMRCLSTPGSYWGY